ncbi:MAG: hypothetical protein RLZZ490_2393 [Cyanobacteriota bacterium]
MTGKVVESDPKGLLVVILPLAVAMVFVYKAWRWILLALAVAIAWVAWDTYQWQQKCLAIDPLFNQLVQKNQGIITQADLVSQGIAKGRAANRYLKDKVGEYGAYQRQVGGSNVYYFISSSTLGSIFDDSEPEVAPDGAPDSPQLQAATGPVVAVAPPQAIAQKETALVNPPEAPKVPTPIVPPEAELTAAPVGHSPFAQLAELKESRKQQEPEVSPESESAAVMPSPKAETMTLIQAELAKRLDTTSSTIARRKTEENFSEWSQSRDPDGLAWAYDADSKIFMAS